MGVVMTGAYETTTLRRPLQRRGVVRMSTYSPTSTSASSLASGQPIVLALQRLREDIDELDAESGRKPQLSPVEGIVLLSTIGVAGGGAFALSAKVLEVLIPACALLVAAIGVSAEYSGRVATFSGKEVAAMSLKAASEAEALLATAERAKSFIPFAVGLTASLALMALLVPKFLVEIGVGHVNELLMICPLLATVAASVSGLAELDATTNAKAAEALGRRRFSYSNTVGRTWTSQTEQVFSRASKERAKLASFAVGVLPAPVFALVCPGDIVFKSVVATATAAAQAGYYLASAEYSVARATEAVSIKARMAAIADTYANQAARFSALLPFTSALAGLCAAVATAVVEVQPALSAIFPIVGALFAASASVSKACCEADAAAAYSAADELASIPPTDGSSLKGFTADAKRGIPKPDNPIATVKRVVDFLRGEKAQPNPALAY